MATSFKDLKQIDNNSKDLVYGYCRKCHESFPSNNAYYSIQPLIMNIIMLYYWIRYKWCDEDEYINKENFKIDDDTVTRIKGTMNRTIFLENIMNANDGGVYEYKFKILHIPSSSVHDMSIGIASKVDKRMKNDCFFLSPNCYGYTTSMGFAAMSSNFTTSYGVICKDGDIVTMIVDLNKYKLSYIVNDKDYGFAHKIAKDCDYKVAVYMYSQKGKIQLIK